MDELKRRLREEMRGEQPPGGGADRLAAKLRRRERGRRVRAGGVGLALTVLIVIAGFAALRSRPDGLMPPPASQVRGSPSEGPNASEPPASSAVPDPDEPPGEQLPGAPPPVTVRFLDSSIDLVPYSFCYRSGCVSGGPGHLPSVGEPDHVIVTYPLAGWSFTAYFQPSGDSCGRIQSAELSAAPDGAFTLNPVGFAGEYDVTLFGDGARGQLSVAFRWTTPIDGLLPDPRAYLALLSNEDDVTSYGVELHVSNLASTPSSAQATITVRASNGNEITFDADAADRRCLQEGTVYWDGPDAKGLAASELGVAPFTYEVGLVLDGVSYTATARWPDDEIEGEEPAVLLEFVPPLPALEG